MARQDQNDAFLQTSFLYGANAAYIEDLYARFQQDPNSVDAEWQAFFGALKDDGAAIAQNARGASWTRPNWPVAANGELISALDGNWGVVEKVVGDKLKDKAKAAADEVAKQSAAKADDRAFFKSLVEKHSNDEATKASEGPRQSDFISKNKPGAAATDLPAPCHTPTRVQGNRNRTEPHPVLYMAERSVALAPLRSYSNH